MFTISPAPGMTNEKRILRACYVVSLDTYASIEYVLHWESLLWLMELRMYVATGTGVSFK